MVSTRFSFASDNHAGIHPDVLRVFTEANTGHSESYGEGDEWTIQAEERFRKLFGEEIVTHFVFTGTAANVLGLQTLTRPHNAILCADIAHLYTDETGAPEANMGCKIIPVPSVHGKIEASQIKGFLGDRGDQHRSQPNVLSITQSTEYGTVYTVEEVRALAQTAHANGLYLHMDGSRIANAAATLGVEMRAFTADAGVDVLSFGGCKNGMAMGEAVVFFRPELGADFRFIRKQGLNLASKMRFITSQFIGLLDNDLWLRNAKQANAMASLLHEELQGVSNLSITHPVQANAVFAILPPESVTKLQEEFDFYVWNTATNEVRWVTAFDTTPDDVRYFASRIREVLTIAGN